MAVAGNPDVTITLTGQNFTPATTVNWRDLDLATTFISNTEVQVVIPAAASKLGHSGASLCADSPGGGHFEPGSVFGVAAAGGRHAAGSIQPAGMDLAWNASNNLLYVAVANTDATHPSSIATLDPAAGKLLSVLPLTPTPMCSRFLRTTRSCMSASLTMPACNAMLCLV